MGRRHIDAVASDASALLADEFRSLYAAAKAANRRPHLLLREYQERIAFEIRYLKKSREKREVRFRRASSKIPGLSKRINAALREALVSSNVPTSRREQAEQKLPGADDVFHEAVIECARYVWKNPSLLYHASPEERRVRNQATVALAFRDIVHNVIRDAIPQDEFDESDEFDSDSDGEGDREKEAGSEAAEAGSEAVEASKEEEAEEAQAGDGVSEEAEEAVSNDETVETVEADCVEEAEAEEEAEGEARESDGVSEEEAEEEAEAEAEEGTYEGGSDRDSDAFAEGHESCSRDGSEPDREAAEPGGGGGAEEEERENAGGEAKGWFEAIPEEDWDAVAPVEPDAYRPPEFRIIEVARKREPKNVFGMPK